MSILITADELAEELASPNPPRVLDVRWRLDRPDGRPAFAEGHIPGAVYVDLDTELAEKGAATEGRHPLPSAALFERAARRWGLNDGDAVVVYDDLGNMSSARAWWLLRHGGVSDVRLLDGGLQAWTERGGALEEGEGSAEPGNVSITFGTLPTLSVEEAGDFPQHGVLLDARAGERFRGETEPVDPRAGHIPGARNTPTGGNLGADGRFLPPETLRERFVAVGITDDTLIATYCGSGVTAAHNLVALTLAGYDAALFPGSWSQWSNLDDLPVETGPARS